MPTKRTNISIPEGLYDLAQKVMAARHYDSFSEYIAELVRADALGKPQERSDTRIHDKSGEYKAKPKKTPCAAVPVRTDYFVVTRKA